MNSTGRAICAICATIILLLSSFFRRKSKGASEEGRIRRDEIHGGKFSVGCVGAAKPQNLEGDALNDAARIVNSYRSRIRKRKRCKMDRYR